MRIRDWKLRTKQIVGFGLVLLIMAAVHFYTIHQMRAIRVELEEVSNSWLPRALAISDVNLSTSSLRINQLQQTLTTDTEATETLTGKSIEIIDQINENLDGYRELRTEAQGQDRFAEVERELYTDFDEAWEEYQDLSFAFYQLLSDGATGEAVGLLNGEAQQVFARLSGTLARLVTVNRLESLQAAERAAATFHSARGVSSMWLLATIVLSVFIAGALVHLITVPVTELERASGEVAQGDLDVRIAVHGSDEIGNLAHSFNQMTDALRQARAERERQAQQLQAQNQELEEALRELEDAQQQLLLSEKMASLGDLVAGVTHELNTPIGAAHSAVDVARRCVQKAEAALAASDDGLGDGTRQELSRTVQILRENLDNTQVATDRILAIVASLKNFARLDEAEHQRADLHQGLDSTLTLMNAEFLGRVAIDRRYGDIPEIPCYPGQLNQVFRIVLKNAAEAIDGEGRIDIATTLRDDRIRIDIKDTGRGIPADRLQQLFDFGFSSGGPRVKLSSGLPTAFNIMQRHRGEILLDSVVGQWTTVTLELPTT